MVGRYALLGEIASGGMATVYFGRLLGPVGFSRTVAIKRLHPQFAKDPEFVAMLLDEARLATRIQHPNVVATLDVVAIDGELLLVLDYVHGESLAHLLREARTAGRPIPTRVLAALASGMLHGLHAAHEARSEAGEPLGIVHRDVSPQNVLVGVDGMARVLDFGIAKAAGRIQQTREGQLKGKLPYMSPEQVRGAPLDRRSDIYSASIVLWEALAGRRLFHGDGDMEVFAQVALGARHRPSELVPALPPAFDDIVMRGLARDPADRYPTAWDMAVAIEEAFGLASPRQVGAWVAEVAGEHLVARSAQITEVERLSTPELLGPAAGASTHPRSESLPSLPLITSILPRRGDAAAPEPISGDLIQPVFGPVPQRRSPLLFGAAVAAVALLVGLGWAIGRGGNTAEPTVVSSAASAPAVQPSPLPAPSVGPSSSAATVSASARAAPLDRPSAARSPQPRSAARCNPPFVVDEAGIRRIKPECL